VGWLDVQTVETASLSNTSFTNLPLAGALCFQRNLDKASPGLLLDNAKGTVIASGTLDLTVTNFSQWEFFRLNLTNVIVTSVTHVGSVGSDARPLEEVCLTPQILSWNYVQNSPRSGLPVNYQSSNWNLGVNTGSSNGIVPVPEFMSWGAVRQPGGVELNWTAAAGMSYRIYAVPDFNQPFVPVMQMTASNTGPTNFMVTPTGAAMFFVVEQIPPGF